MIESYERIMAFIAKHLSDPFYLEHDQQISIRDTIFREIASNILIHREYMNPFPAKLIIEPYQVRTENSNKPHGFGLIDPARFSPFPKNPVIARFFREMGRADELGSGVRNLMKYSKAYGNSNPILEEGDIFHIIVKLPESEKQPFLNPLTEIKPIPPAKTLSGGESGGESETTKKTASTEQTSPSQQVTQQVTRQVTQQVTRLLKIIKGEMNRSELMQAVALKDRVNFAKNYLEPAIRGNMIEMTQPNSPKSPTQKYRLTDRGRDVVERIGPAEKRNSKW